MLDLKQLTADRPDITAVAVVLVGTGSPEFHFVIPTGDQATSLPHLLQLVHGLHTASIQLHRELATATRLLDEELAKKAAQLCRTDG